jgi:hypothetical protein
VAARMPPLSADRAEPATNARARIAGQDGADSPQDRRPGSLCHRRA